MLGNAMVVTLFIEYGTTLSVQLMREKWHLLFNDLRLELITYRKFTNALLTNYYYFYYVLFCMSKSYGMWTFCRSCTFPFLYDHTKTHCCLYKYKLLFARKYKIDCMNEKSSKKVK